MNTLCFVLSTGFLYCQTPPDIYPPVELGPPIIVQQNTIINQSAPWPDPEPPWHRLPTIDPWEQDQ